ncbi:uncharacterized protein [Cicer arietinum]|uniref:Uncharacterized protein LOC113784868 n=1 Tax=Cicer arietinum TaxID=3827 RepID=A0A3Q7WZ96_CICAR|nr:uncharacterized protein LOC113784868 [Cicer arietinum]
MLTKVRKKGTRPSWIGEEAWTGLQAYWEGTSFKNISNQNKTNRASTRGGAVHTSGRKAHIDVAIELSNNLQRDLLPDELFLTTHKRKNGAWVDSRAESTYGTFKKKLEEVQTQIGETSEESGKEVDGGTILKLWTESAGGRTRGRVYGTGDLSINVRQGCVSLTQHSQNPSNSMTGTSLEAERAARIRAEQIAQDAVSQAQVATKVAEEARERSKKLENDFDALKQFFGDKFDALARQSTGGSSTASHPPSHPHYDHNLDDVSLDEP